MKLLSGSEYIKVDLHSHTQADKEFISSYKNNLEKFAQIYVEQLKKQEIGVVAITNHNKFAQEEFFMIRDKAKQEGILVLPGVELSIEEGKRGLHVLCIFPQELAENQNNVEYSFIENFLAKMFNGERFDANSDPLPATKSIREMIDLLDNQLKYPHILVFAHVDNSKGCFKELGWPIINQFVREKWMRTTILGLQGINNSSRKKLECEIQKVAKELGVSQISLTPAYIEASDPKRLEDVGTVYTWIKLGELSFNSLQFALSQPALRVQEPPQWQAPYLKKIRFTTHKGLTKSEINFNNDLNTLIGIRGSGKSTVIENIRYVFNIEPLDDIKYKKDLITTHLGSGGKIELEVFNKGQEYRIERIFDELPKVFKGGEYIPDVRPSDLLPIVYYGQKDLQKRVQEPKLMMDIIDQYIGERLIEVQNKTIKLEDEIKNILYQIRKLKKNVARKDEILQNQANVELKIEDFQRLNIADQLKLEANYKKDEMVINSITKVVLSEKKISQDFQEQIENTLDTVHLSLSEYNKELLDELTTALQKHKISWQDIFNKINHSNEELATVLQKVEKKFKEKRENIAEEIAKIKREIQVNEVSPDDYSKLIQTREQNKIVLQEIEKYENKLAEYQKQKKAKYQQIQALWHELYLLRSDKVEEINNEQDIIKIEVNYKGDKDSFAEYLRVLLQGSRISTKKIERITDEFSDGLEILNAIENNAAFDFFTENEKYQFIERCQEQEEALALYRVKDTIQIFYKGKALMNLSLGQRASSLLMLLLTLDNKPLIIDQPEDDLDNQMIYDGLVKELLKLKKQRQIIFATHNSNIPVLGDCEQVIVCNNQNDKISFIEGSIDTKEIQQSIVNIMEGGKDAFAKRKEIYDRWM